MIRKEKSKAGSASGANLLRRIWGALPGMIFIMLVVVIVMLTGHIKSQGEIVKEKAASSLKKEVEKANVVAMEMLPRRIQDKINLPGVVQPWVSLTVVAEVRGKIEEKRVQDGQQVRKGDVLAVIDDRDYRNALQSAKATYEAALASRNRLSALFKDQLATQSQLDDAVARVKTTKAALDSAALNLDRCTIRSPLAGVVDRLHIENGKFVNSGDPIALVLRIDRVKIEVGIPESDVDAVRSVENFRISIDALGGKEFTGEYHYLSKSTNSMARLYRLEVAVDNPEGLILPDMFTRVEIVKKEVEDGLALPLYALLTRKGENSVFVISGDSVERRNVELGIRDGWKVEVVRGIDAGDRVVVVGQRGIEQGDTVNVVQTVRDVEELLQ